MHADRQPRVAFVRTQLPQSLVLNMTRLSRDVARWNGNTTWSTPIKLITDDTDLTLYSLGGRDRSYEKRATRRFDENTGVFWPDSGVIWISPTAPSFYLPRVLAHEVAHALAAGVHGETWRRMYALLFPLWCDAVHAVNGTSTRTLDDYATFDECRRVVETYAHYPSARRSGLEMRRLHDMADRSRARWVSDVQRVVGR